MSGLFEFRNVIPAMTKTKALNNVFMIICFGDKTAIILPELSMLIIKMNRSNKTGTLFEYQPALPQGCSTCFFTKLILANGYSFHLNNE